MKITDNELLQAIWENQLHRLTTRTLHHYVGKGHGVCPHSRGWYSDASSEHIRFCPRIQTPISPGQLRIRLKKLATEKMITTDSNRDGRFLTFYIDTPTALQAFTDARQFWLDNGVPEGESNGKSNAALIPERDALAEQCAAMLLEKHPTYSDED